MPGTLPSVVRRRLFDVSPTCLRGRRCARNGAPLLTPSEAWCEAEELLLQFEVLHPNDAIVRTAIRGTAAYGMSWFDAHMWAYADQHGLDTLYSEDFAHGRVYGTVRVVNPFV